MHRVRLYPTVAQEVRLRFMLDVTRQTYNALLDQRRYVWTSRLIRVTGLEALNLRGMTRSAKGTIEQRGRRVAAKRGLNRAMLHAGFGILRRLIGEKAAYATRRVIDVEARYSSQRAGVVCTSRRKVVGEGAFAALCVAGPATRTLRRRWRFGDERSWRS